MIGFLHPALLWGLSLVAIPIVIHLINLTRRRRVRWAAMEFLLASLKKNRTWILLKELLLLLARCAAVAAVALMLARPNSESGLGRLLGAGRVHHLVLVDDSYSMSDQDAAGSAFRRALDVVERIGDHAAQESTEQLFTLLRYSRAGGTRGTRADLLAQKVDSGFGVKLNEALSGMEGSQAAAGPASALAAIRELAGADEQDRRVLYLISDFREGDWDESNDLPQSLDELESLGVEIHLVDCVEQTHENLAITALAPREATRAAGVPLPMEVTVRNFGAETARRVPVLLAEDGIVRPAVEIDEIPPMGSETRRFQVFFPTAGQHEVSARLSPDAVAADNARFETVDFPVTIPVLVVDGSPDAPDGYFLSSALQPGGAVATGISCRIETPAFLSSNSLDEYQAIYALNVDHFDSDAIAALERYAKAGGGVAFFLGDRVLGETYNRELYRGGEGLFPLPLTAKTELLIDRRGPDRVDAPGSSLGADILAGDHPIFRGFGGERNSFLSAVRVDAYFGAPLDWNPPEGSAVEIVARLRNRAPFVVSRPYGEGRVVAFLTSLSAEWGNWRLNPSFVITAQETQAFLTRRASVHEERLVGAPLEIGLEKGSAEIVKMVAPLALTDGFPANGSTTGDLTTVSRQAAPTAEGSSVVFPETDTPGVYRVEWTRVTDNAVESRRYAINVASGEGRMARVDPRRLAETLADIEYDFQKAAAFRASTGDSESTGISDALLYFLAGLLLVEQVLAYLLSYHPSPGGSSA